MPNAGCAHTRRARPRLAGRLARRVGVALLVPAVLFAILPGPASADTATDLEAARVRLKALEGTVQAAQDALAATRSRFQELVAELSGARAAYDATEAKISDTRYRLAAAQREYADVRSSLDQQAVAAYIQGPGSGLEIVLGSTSPADFVDRLRFMNGVAAQGASLARRLHGLTDVLSAQRERESSLLADQAVDVATLNDAQDAMVQTLADREGVVAGVQRTSDEIAALISQLKDQLKAEEQAKELAMELAAAQAAQAELASVATGSVSFGGWADLLLKHLQLPECQSNLVVIVAWEAQEGTRAAWNPLASGYDMPGATDFNWVGVENYVSLEQGLEAIDRTLHENAIRFRYGAILDGLTACADPMVTAMAIHDSAWCFGCGDGQYLIALIPAVALYFERFADRSKFATP